MTEESRLTVVNNGVPTPPPLRQRAVKLAKPNALFIATAEAKRKGVDDVLKAAERLGDRLSFTFVGCTRALEEQVVKRGLSRCITTFPSVSRTELKERFYPEADLFLIPSHGEGFPNSMLEAMAAGLPILGSFAGAIPEVIEEGVNGFLNHAGDAVALIEDIERLINDPNERQRMGIQNHRKIVEKYTLDIAFQPFERVWKRAIDQQAIKQTR